MAFDVVPWTKHPLADFLMRKTHANGLEYHSGIHIQSGYNFFNQSAIGYDQELDIAWAGHDIIYDNKPYKERRSADYVVSLIDELGYNYLDTDLIWNLIMATEKHEIDEELEEKDLAYYIIAADLNDLAYPDRVLTNFELIKKESMRLYGISDTQFAQANLDFMQGLHNRLYGQLLTKKHTDGISKTMELARKILNNNEAETWKKNDIINQVEVLWNKSDAEMRAKILQRILLDGQANIS